jgi:hypothetical protein
LYKVRQLLSKRWGVTETADGLDIRFNHLDELISHPLVRYLNYRNNIIFDKIEYFNKVIQSGLFEQESILKLSSYSQEEFIPSKGLDSFFTNNTNELKFKVKSSTQLRSVQALMRRVDNETEGKDFQ